MKIVFVSDTHGDEDALKNIVEFSKGYDAIIHTGDVLPYGVAHSCFISDYISTLSNIYFVRGNTDYFDGMRLMGKDVSEYERIFSFDNLRIFATHGFIKSMTTYEKEARENKCGSGEGGAGGHRCLRSYACQKIGEKGQSYHIKSRLSVKTEGLCSVLCHT